MLIDPKRDKVAFKHVVAAMDKAGISEDAKLEMYKNRRFGIDWGVGPSVSDAATSQKDWSVSMEKMWDLCRDGGLVFYPCKNIPRVNGGLIGQVPVGADIELHDYESESGDVVTMKTLKLHRVREIHPDDHTGLFDDINYGRYTVHSLNTHRDKVITAYVELY